MSKYNTEVLIYVSKIRTFIENNEESNRYFLEGKDPKIFFDCLLDKSQRIFNDHGYPELSLNDFEELKRAADLIVKLEKINDNDDNDLNETSKWFNSRP